MGRRLLQIHDLEEPKQRVGKLVVLVLIGEFLQQALKMPARDHQDLLYLGIGIVLVAAALFLTGRLEAQGAAHDANLDEAGVDRGPGSQA